MSAHRPCLQRFATIAEIERRMEDTDPTSWLSPAERGVWTGMRSPARRLQYVAGRWLARELLSEAARSEGEDPVADAWEIASRDARGHAMRPRITHGGRHLPWSLSISHSDDAVLVAVSTRPGTNVGVDLVPMRALGRGFAATWFTAHERAWCGDGEDPWRASAIWAVKEALYKAAGGGDPFVPNNWPVSTTTENTVALGLSVGDASVRLRRLCGHVAAVVICESEEAA